MTTKEIVDNYLKELGFNNKIGSLQEISELIKAHEKTFSFSSMKVLLKDEISLELQDIYESVVVQKRGGYCFEHNKLFYEVLKELDFDVEFYLARVINNTENEVPQTHRFTLLNFGNERYLIDVGIGFRSPSVPIKFGDIDTPSHLNLSYTIKEFDNNSFGLQVLQNNKTYTITNFDLNKCYETDFEMGHFYSHKHPCAVVVNNLVISIINENQILSLRNNNYLKSGLNNKEEIFIESLNEFSTILKDDFNCRFSDNEIELIYQNYVKENK